MGSTEGALTCSSCGGSNPQGAKFCNSCGTALVATCARCGHQNPPTSSFCNECGAALATATHRSFATPEAYTPDPLAAKIRAARDTIEGERVVLV